MVDDQWTIARAALDLFVSHGWAATTVRDVAREAGVSVPAGYAAYGNKAGLTRALADAADLSADVPRLITELESPTTDPARRLAAMAGYDRRQYERAGDVSTLLREAGRSEAELATLYQDSRLRGDRTRVQVFSSLPPCRLAALPPGVLRSGLDVPSAADVYAALYNIDDYTVLTGERGWSPDRLEQWWCRTLARELLDRATTCVTVGGHGLAWACVGSQLAPPLDVLIAVLKHSGNSIGSARFCSLPKGIHVQQTSPRPGPGGHRPPGPRCGTRHGASCGCCRRRTAR